MPESLKNGGLTLERIDIPESVNPGRSVTAKVTVSNDADWIDPFDDAKCDNDGTFGNWGYHTTVVFTDPSGETQRESHCVKIGERQIFEFTFDAPSSEGEVFAEAKMVVDGNLGGETDKISQAFIVGTRDPAEEEVNYDDGFNLPGQDDGTPNDGGDSSPFSFGLELGKQEKLALGLVIVLIAAAVLRPYASMGASAAEVAT